MYVCPGVGTDSNSALAGLIIPPSYSNVHVGSTPQSFQITAAVGSSDTLAVSLSASDVSFSPSSTLTFSPSSAASTTQTATYTMTTATSHTITYSFPSYGTQTGTKFVMSQWSSTFTALAAVVRYVTSPYGISLSFILFFLIDLCHTCVYVYVSNACTYGCIYVCVSRAGGRPQLHRFSRTE
jgi:hypothetical protein